MILSRLVHFAGWFAPSHAPDAPVSASAAQGQAPVRIGILGAANIAGPALMLPAKWVPDARVVAVAARDEARAKRFAAKHGIPKTYGSYEVLLRDEEIDAVYVPSPNGLHAAWAIKALKAGKHVLVEKPVTSNADEARALAAAAVAAKRVVMEAAHTFHHPALARIRDIVRSGELGDLTGVETVMQIPIRDNADIRFNVNGSNAKLAGGAMMDAGSYVVNAARYVTDSEVGEVVSAKAHERFPGVDDEMEAEFTLARLPAVKGRLVCSFNAGWREMWFNATLTVTGTRGSMHVTNFLAPFVYHAITVRGADGRRVRTEKVYGDTGASTYEYQLREFVDRVRNQPEGGLAKTKNGGVLDDFVGEMVFIDAVYEKSGMAKRAGYAESEVR